jgi:hypothetical protein
MRLFVQAVTWADVVTIDGRRISKRAWAGQAVEGRTNIDWPNQGDPTRADLRIWRRMLTSVVCKIEDEEQIKRIVRNEIPPTLQTGLGWWLETMRTGWEYCSGTQQLHQTEGNKRWVCESDRPTRNGYRVYGSPTSVRNIPPTGQPARVRMKDGKAILIGWGYREAAENEPTPNDFREAINHSVTKEQWLWHHQEWATGPEEAGQEEETLVQAIQRAQAIGVSDGTLKDGKGAAAAVIEGEDERGHVLLSSLTSGTADQQSSYRSELTGIMMIVSFVEELCKFRNIQAVGNDGLVRWQGSGQCGEQV